MVATAAIGVVPRMVPARGTRTSIAAVPPPTTTIVHTGSLYVVSQIIRPFSQFDYLSITAQRSIFFFIIPSASGRGILNKQTMVSISEKIAHTSLHQIKLYKQGLFWVAYEQSAYYIWQLKGFKPTKKWLKNIKSEVVQVGFPGIEEFLLTDNLEIIEKQDTFISCTSTQMLWICLN